MSQACPRCHAEMIIAERFKLDHEPGDSERDTESLLLFEAMGIELGAEVTSYRCPKCGRVIALFGYPDDARASSRVAYDS